MVQAAPRWFAKAFEGAHWVAQAPGVWSATGYLWHVVDVLRVGTERFWLLALDPRRGMAPWDPDETARVRAYDALSIRVGRRALEASVEDWLVARAATPSYATATHPVFGAVDGAYLAHFYAHEVVHHVMDVRRQRG